MGTKVLHNSCHGGFSVSELVLRILNDEYGFNFTSRYLDDRVISRHDERLIEAVERVGLESASGRYAELEIEDIGDADRYYIEEYDGMETVHTVDNIEWVMVK